MAIERMLPVYEAKMIHHYDQKWATYGTPGATTGPAGFIVEVPPPIRDVERMLRVVGDNWVREVVCIDAIERDGKAVFFYPADAVLMHEAGDLVADNWAVDHERGVATRPLAANGGRWMRSDDHCLRNAKTPEGQAFWQTRRETLA